MNLKEELKAYVDNELTPDQRTEIERAAQTSAEIRDEIDALRALKTEFEGLTITPEPAGKASLVKVLRDAAPKPERTFVWGRLVAGLAAALLVVAVVPEFGRSVAGSAQADVASVASSLLEIESANSESAAPEPKASMPAFAADQPVVPSDHADAKMELRESRSAISPKPEVAPVVPSQYGRDIIYNGSIAVEVPDVQKAVLEATSLIQGLGGFIVSSQTSLDEEQQASAQLELRVPAAKFDTANKSLAKFGKVLSQNTSGEDVTGQIARSEGRTRALAVAEQEYIRMLNNTRNTSARLEVRRRLDEVRAEREGIRAELARLKDLAALSNLSLSFSQSPSVRPEETGENWWNDSNTGAANALGAVGRVVGRAAIYALYLAPVWVVGLVGWAVWRKRR